MAFVVINTLSSEAQRGEDAIVSLSSGQAAIYLGGIGAIHVGERAQVVSSNVYGYVSEIDVYGTTFRIKPQYPSGNMASVYNPGVLNANELITLF